MRRGFSIPGCLAALALAGCFTIGDATVPIATLSVAAPRPSGARTLVIVLPGIGGDAEEMRRERLPEAIHRGWPEADVVLASATLAYYRDGRLVSRLDAEIVEPALRKGYTHLWLAGASLGGMGALLYEREHPGKTTGIVLFAPFLGESDLLGEIRSAGGVQKWDPGPLPPQMGPDNYQRQVWKMVKGWTTRRDLARRVWLAVGTDDRMIAGARLLEPLLEPAHWIELPGGHTWDLWRVGATEVFAHIRAESTGVLRKSGL